MIGAFKWVFDDLGLLEMVSRSPTDDLVPLETEANALKGEDVSRPRRGCSGLGQCVMCGFARDDSGSVSQTWFAKCHTVRPEQLQTEWITYGKCFRDVHRACLLPRAAWRDALRGMDRTSGASTSGSTTSID